MKKEIVLPWYLRFAIVLIGFLALLTLLYLGQSIIIPLVFAVFFGIVLNPVVNLFVKLRINRVVAISLTLLCTFLFISGCGTIIISQAVKFADSWPMLVDNTTKLINQTIIRISAQFDIDPLLVHTWLKTSQNEFLNFSSLFAGKAIWAIGNWVIIMLLIPVYVFLVLYYRPLLIEFVHRLFSMDSQNKVSEIVLATKEVIQRYLVGLLIQSVIVGILYITALLCLGIDYAILLGIIGALLNIIPYVGGIVGVALPIMVALATKTSIWHPLYILIIYSGIQFIDNNYITPILVSSKVKINALFSILIVIAGNALWGISGMFLSIPLIAIIKLILDRIDSLKAWGFLLGDTMPTTSIFKLSKIKPT